LESILTEKEVAHLRSLDDEEDRLEHLQEVIEDHYLGKPTGLEWGALRVED
jgi:hypothetical protein